MKQFIRFFLILIVQLPVVGGLLLAQEVDLIAHQEALLSQRWQDAQKNQSGVYNGREYINYTRLLKDGHPFYDTTVALMGSVHYNQITYAALPLMLDLVKDELIVQHFNNVFLIQLVKSKIDWFTIGSHFFEHLGRDSAKGLSPGFYDRVYEGRSARLYVKRQKTIQEVINDMRIERIVLDADKYYIFKDGQFHSVYTKSSVFRLLGNKNELNHSLRQNKIKFKANRELAIKMMVQLADTL